MARYVESFEGIKAGPNAVYDGNGFFRVGTEKDYKFESGLKYIYPVPNALDSEVRSRLGDFSVPGGNPVTSLLNGGVATKADVPDGTAYFALATSEADELQFEIAEGAYSVRAFVDAPHVSGSRTITVMGFDKGGRELVSASVETTVASKWAKNEITLVSDKPIHFVNYYAPGLIIDKVIFTTHPGVVIRGTNGDDEIGYGVTVAGQRKPSFRNDVINGRDGDDDLSGLGGADAIHGGKGDDRLWGKKGNDILDGGRGADVLTGNGGKNTFVFDVKPSTGVDRIKDFDPGRDTIHLAASKFPGLAFGDLDDGAFAVGGEATGPDQRILYDGVKGRLLLDSDGAGGSEAVQEVGRILRGRGAGG